MSELRITFDNEFLKKLEATANSPTIAPGSKTKSDIIQNAVALYIYLHEQVENKPNLRVALIDNADANRVVSIINPLP